MGCEIRTSLLCLLFSFFYLTFQTPSTPRAERVSRRDGAECSCERRRAGSICSPGSGAPRTCRFPVTTEGHRPAQTCPPRLRDRCVLTGVRLLWLFRWSCRSLKIKPSVH
ncbi:unnamed protein product [Gulo gulo]|uniref:Secreted protein n=1 Tax=Gulo gulo TaxID=48420 RepID=A0A9X9LIF0_GULGU|nr:unnamed protein product [Gulo gulo]